MEVEMSASRIFMSLVVVGVLGLIGRLYIMLVVNPNKIRRKLENQGISGPKPKILLGNLLEMKKLQNSVAKPATEPPQVHNLGAILLPFFDTWKKQFGENFMFAIGNAQILLVTQPDIVRDMTTCTSLDFGKPLYQAKERGALLGNGILTSNGHFWAYQRKIIAPQLYMDKVKDMHKLIAGCAQTLLDSWNTVIKENDGTVGDIEIDSYIRSFSGDVISRACFGSNFQEGKQIFSKLRELQELSSKRGLVTGIPGIRHTPTKHNRKVWALEKESYDLIMDIVKQRVEVGYKNDLLQVILEGAQDNKLGNHAIDRFIVDNCKNIYLAGYETTAVATTWTLMLLATNQDWQDRVRSEATEICKGQIPDADAVSRMKVLTMVIHESLRLYPPVVIVSREAFKDVKFKGIHVPKGVNVWTVVTALHTDPENWGDDSYKFNPNRFANGVAGACKLPHLYMPFGVGPRVCLGQNLAWVELKILISLIVSNFSFSISSKYVHSPALNLVSEPGQGVNLLVRKL